MQRRPSVVRKALDIAEDTQGRLRGRLRHLDGDAQARHAQHADARRARRRAPDEFTVDQFADHLAKTFGKKFTQDVIDANVEAVRRAAEEVTVE